MRKKILLLSIFLIYLSLTGCRIQTTTTTESNNNSRGNVTRNVSEKNFEDVCNGSKVPEAAEFDKTPGTTSPIYIFYQPDTGQSFRSDIYNFPDDWKTDYSDMVKTQLVACITVSDRKEIKTCPYEEDGKIYKLKLNNARFNVKVYEPQTGAVVAEKDFDLKADKECPMISFFTDTEATDDPDYKQTVINFLKPFVKH